LFTPNPMDFIGSRGVFDFFQRLSLGFYMAQLDGYWDFQEFYVDSVSTARCHPYEMNGKKIAGS